MDFENNKKYDLFLRVDSFNTNNKTVNLTCTLSDTSTVNVKVNDKQFNDIILKEVYYMNVTCINNGTRDQLVVNKFDLAINQIICDDLEKALRVFYECAPVSIMDLKNRFEKYLKSIKNKILKEIVLSLFKDYEKKFYISSAGLKMHHAYIGGLLYHTVSMLDLCEGFIKVYPSLDKDYLISGIILHDIMKVEEINSSNTAEYSLEGQLIGHIVMSALAVERKAIELKYNDTEEVLVLKHMLLSHHGQLSFGSPKKPMTQEALLLSSLDSIDSKMRVLEEELEKTDEGTFTNNIMVLERGKFYKTKTK